MKGWQEQEPVTNYRRDWTAWEAARAEVEQHTAAIVREVRVRIAWTARRINREVRR
jgi:hypothetical protein